MLKKIKELLGFPTEQEKAAAKVETTVESAVPASQNVFPFPKGDKPEAVAEAKPTPKPKAKRAPKPKAEPAAKAPAKKPATKKAGTPKAPATTAKKPRRTKAV
jgi:hypothetical protein